LLQTTTLRSRGCPAARSATAVRAYCDGPLSHCKIPRYAILVEDFPMTVAGRIRKVAVREESSKLGLS